MRNNRRVVPAFEPTPTLIEKGNATYVSIPSEHLIIERLYESGGRHIILTVEGREVVVDGYKLIDAVQKVLTS